MIKSITAAEAGTMPVSSNWEDKDEAAVAGVIVKIKAMVTDISYSRNLEGAYADKAYRMVGLMLEGAKKVRRVGQVLSPLQFAPTVELELTYVAPKTN